MKGTPSMGGKSGKKNHLTCRRCGKLTYHKKKKRCASCGFGATATQRSFKFYKKH